MKTKIVAILSLLLGAALIAGCGVIPGLGNDPNMPPSTPIGPINSNYSNAISPAEQLIVGTMNLQGNLAVTPDEATQLVPLWEVYQTLIGSNTAAPQELQAALDQVERTMTSDQIQAIVSMKLTRQDMGTVFQQMGISTGPRGTGTPRSSGGGFGGGGFPGGPGGGGIPGVTGGGQGGFGVSGGATPNAKLQAGASSGTVNAGLVKVLIQFLKSKNPALSATSTPSAATATPMPSETPTP